MILPLALVVVVVALALAAWAALRTARDQPVVLRQLWAAAVVEATLLVQVAVAVVLVARGRSPHESSTFWIYVVTELMVLPLAAVWAFDERTRWSSVVLLVAGVTIAVMQWRMVQIWGA